jgi:hypothetical protein
MTADELREFARASLASDKAWDTDGTGRPYYHCGDREMQVVKSFVGAMKGRYLSFDLLDDGDIVGWFDREMYDLGTHARDMAEAIDSWNRIVSR